MVIDLASSQDDSFDHGPAISIEPKLHGRHSNETHDSTGEREAAGRIRTLAPTAQNLDEVMSLVRNISTHLEGQTERTDRLIDCMSRLPAALEALPEINRQNARLLEIVGDYLGHARRRDDALNGTLSGINEASMRHTEVLGLLQQQLDASGRSTDALTDQLGDFREALSALAGSNARTTTVLSDMAQSNEHREFELTRMLARTQKWLLAAMICCAAMSAAAITVAAIATLM
jgi:hypothetical protein